MTKRKKKPDPIKALRKKYPGKWLVRRNNDDGLCGPMNAYRIDTVNYMTLLETDDLQLARAICKLGNGK